jgi:hypothetical protein
MICRDVRQVLAGIRSLGLTRTGRAAAGLPGDFAIERADIPADPEHGEPGRNLPPEIMAVLCANLDSLEPVEVRVATQIGIDTGRRPEDILNLGLDCLARDKDGGDVLVYDNIKANRLGRRLPISTATAEVITGQQQRIRQRFPHTPAAKLKLLPTLYRNPDGHKAIRRRDAVDTVTALSFDRHGNRIWRDAHALMESDRARHAIGEVAVPYGTCTEPTNVKASGGACPVRFRCVGCDHFRTNIAYLPELQAYLDDLLRTRERLAATIDGVDDWARADATPPRRRSPESGD